MRKTAGLPRPRSEDLVYEETEEEKGKQKKEEEEEDMEGEEEEEIKERYKLDPGEPQSPTLGNV